MSGPSYIAAIGDLVASREIVERAETQRQLQYVFRHLRQKGNCASPWTITLGDEFQAVYSKSAGLFDDLLETALALWPHEIRFSLALAPLDTKLNRKQALGMDGPAFHLAREGLENLKRNRRHFSLRIAGADAPALDLLGAILFRSVYQARNASRVEILLGLIRENSGKDIARHLKLAESTVSQHINSAGLEDLAQAANLIEHSLRARIEELPTAS